MNAGDPETRLPPELFHLILDNLDDEKSSLLACSTVSRGWRCFCRPRIFHTVDINGACRKATFDHFVTFLNEHPDLASAVRDIRLYAQDSWATECLLSLSTLSRILYQLPNIQTVTLEDVNIVVDDNFHPSDESYDTRDVGLLNLKGVKFPVSLPVEHRLLHFHSLLNLFSRIDDLRLLCCRFGLDQDAMLKPSSSLTVSIKSILVSCWTLADNPSILNALQTEGEPSILRSLAVHCCRSDDVKSIGGLVKASSSTLEQFTINIDPMVQTMVTRNESPNTEFWRAIPLESCAALREVTLEGFVLNGIFPDSTRASFSALLDILSLLPALLTSITIVIKPAPPLILVKEVIGALDWHLLENELSRFKGLEKVEFRISTKGAAASLSAPTESSELMSDICAAMPTLSSKDVCRFVE